MPVKHIYPPTAKLDVGSVALCGHVKDTPWSGASYTGDTGPDRCAECLAELERRAA